MSRIHVLLADVPPLLGDIVSMLAEEPGLQIVGRVGPDSNLDQAIQSTGADVVLKSARMDRTVTCVEFLHRHPRVRLLTLSGDADHLQVCELRPHEVLIRDVSPGDLLKATLGESAGPAGG